MAVRVLHVISEFRSGGAESFIMNVYRKLDHSVVQFDFLLRSRTNYFEKEQLEGGSFIFYTASFPRHFIQNYRQLQVFFRDHQYDIIHVHGNALLYVSVLKVAKKAGVKCRIMHSHNTNACRRMFLPVHYFNKLRIKSLATDYFACSESAGEWMFGDGFKIIPNAIDVQKYKYNPAERQRLREELGIPLNSLVIGHVGRFVAQKNHKKILEIFDKVYESNKNSFLVLIGEGTLENEIKKQVLSLPSGKNIKILGARKDVNLLLNVFDIFLFPSLYEGLALVLIETQANGLTVISSDVMPKEIVFSQKMKMFPLDVPSETWANYILSADTERENLIDIIRDAGYDADLEAQQLAEFYVRKASKSTTQII